MKSRQLRLRFPRRRRRGRKPGKGRRPVPHRARARFVRATPVHVRLHVRPEVPRLRTRRLAQVIRKALYGGCKKPGFRICQFSIQRNHIHLVCEANHHEALARGMQGFNVRLARGINRRLGRSGSVLRERYDMTLMRVPRQVRVTLSYVFHNARRHGARVEGADIYSSARYFDGWSAPTGLPPPSQQERKECPVAAAQTQLLAKRWRWCGLISPYETPPAARDLARR